MKARRKRGFFLSTKPPQDIRDDSKTLLLRRFEKCPIAGRLSQIAVPPVQRPLLAGICRRSEKDMSGIEILHGLCYECHRQNHSLHDAIPNPRQAPNALSSLVSMISALSHVRPARPHVISMYTGRTAPVAAAVTDPVGDGGGSSDVGLGVTAVKVADGTRSVVLAADDLPFGG